MKWINHKAITFSVTYYLSGNIFYSLISALGAIFPDWIEGFDYKNPNWKKNHRTYSHWCFSYILILLITTLFFVAKFQISFSDIKKIVSLKVAPLDNLTYLAYGLFFWFIAGCLFHIIQDAFTGGIPVFSPTKKVKWLSVIKTGTIWEYIASIIIVVLTFVLR